MIHRFTIRPQLRSPNILWDNVLAKGTLVASSATASGPGVNAIDQATNTAWIVSGTSATLTVTLAAETECNALGIAAHALAGRTVSAEYWNGTAWISVASLLVPDANSFMLVWTGVSSTQWRISVSGGEFYIGVAYLGNMLTVPGAIQPPHTPLHFCERVELLGGEQSRTGQFLKQDIKVYAGDAALQFEVQYPQFVLSEFEAFRQWFNRGNAFFIACQPNTLPDDMGYCWRTGAEIVPPYRDAVFMDLAMGVGVYRG